MSNNNYQSNENQGYTFNVINSFYPCATDQPSTCYQGQSRMTGGGLVGPGTHIEEASEPSVPPAGPSNHKAGGRGRKNRKKKTAVTLEPLKVEPVEELDNKNFIEANSAGLSDIGIPGISGDLGFQLNPQPEDVPSNENQTHFNSNTLEQILSYKKMMLFQSPEILEFIQKQRNLNKK